MFTNVGLLWNAGGATPRHLENHASPLSHLFNTEGPGLSTHQRVGPRLKITRDENGGGSPRGKIVIKRDESFPSVFLHCHFHFLSGVCLCWTGQHIIRLHVGAVFIMSARETNAPRTWGLLGQKRASMLLCHRLINEVGSGLL